jgi:hypothetical protein
MTVVDVKHHTVMMVPRGPRIPPAKRRAVPRQTKSAPPEDMKIEATHRESQLANQESDGELRFDDPVMASKDEGELRIDDIEVEQTEEARNSEEAIGTVKASESYLDRILLAEDEEALEAYTNIPLDLEPIDVPDIPIIDFDGTDRG